MSERLTHSDVFGGILTNSEIHHFGGAHTGTRVAYCGEPIDKLFEVENMCYDASGNEIIPIDRLREIAAAEREGRVKILPFVPGTRFAQDEDHEFDILFPGSIAYIATCNEDTELFTEDEYAEFASVQSPIAEAARALAAEGVK